MPPITQREWREIMGTSPSAFPRDDLPVEQVSWLDAVDYCNRRSTSEGLEPCYTIDGASVSCDFARNGYRLPTEAEWEYAGRNGGKDYAYCWGEGQPAGNIADESARKHNPGWRIWFVLLRDPRRQESLGGGYAGASRNGSTARTPPISWPWFGSSV